MKYWSIKYYVKNKPKDNFANYRGFETMPFETKELAEEYATNSLDGKNRDFAIEELTKENFDFLTKMD